MSNIDGPYLLVDLAYRAIKDDILTKQLVPGKKIVVHDLSQRYQISETPIKQALNRLITEGLVESIPRRGVTIKKLTLKGLRDMMQARRMIELFAVPQILQKAKEEPQFVDILNENTCQLEESLKTASASDYYAKQNQLDTQFHVLLVGTLENEKISEIYSHLGTHLVVFYLYGVKQMERFLESLEEHKEILRAVRNLDRKELEEALLHHLDMTEADSQKNLTQVLKNCSVFDPDKISCTGKYPPALSVSPRS